MTQDIIHYYFKTALELSQDLEITRANLDAELEAAERDGLDRQKIEAMVRDFMARPPGYARFHHNPAKDYAERAGCPTKPT